MDKELIFKEIKKASISDKNILIPELCTGMKVLDVGCVGQDFDYDSPGWMHNKIKNTAFSVDGVDIDSEGITKLREKGYNIFSPDELKSTGRMYDIIVMSDVIEHVDDPVAFLKFYSVFLSKTGRIIITTPNAHGIRNFTSILIRNSYSVNPEHTFWFCPKTMLEVTSRAGLKYAGFYWSGEYSKMGDLKGFKYKFIYLFNRFFEKMRSNYNPNFMFIASK